MWPLAHLGVGSVMGRACSSRLPFRWLLLGTLLPDLIDKPVYFGLGVYEYLRTGGWIPGKRGVAHTALFLLLLVGVAIARKSAPWFAVAVGTATHLFLDVISKLIGTHNQLHGTMAVLFWPLLGWNFPTLPYGLHGWLAFVFELIGLALLMIQLAVPRFRPSVR